MTNTTSTEENEYQNDTSSLKNEQNIKTSTPITNTTSTEENEYQNDTRSLENGQNIKANYRFSEMINIPSHGN